MKEEARKAKTRVLISFVVFSIIIALFLALGIRYVYWHSFSERKWTNHPEKRAKMTGDLLHDYNLIGMSKEQILRLLGPDNNDYGYFNQENRWVYYLGSERTIIDSEWLLIDFEDNIVHEYAMTID